MRWAFYIILIALAGFSWMKFSEKGAQIRNVESEINRLEEVGDMERVPALKGEIQALESDRTLSGILLTFVSAGVLGILFAVYVLPLFAQSISRAVYDSGEMVEKDVMHDARSLVAQGDYEGAIAAFRQAAAKEPLNRLPWLEIAKLQKDTLQDSAAAIETIRHGLASQEWEPNDAAFFLFRLAEIYDAHEGGRESAKAIMQQVMDEFPHTRHTANAKHKLHEWEVQEAAAAKKAGEARYLAGNDDSAG